MTIPSYTGIPLKNKVLDNSGNLLPEYCNIRYIYIGGQWGPSVFHDYEIELIHAVENAIATNRGLDGLAKVEWRGAHIGDEWRDVTKWYRNAYHREINHAE